MPCLHLSLKRSFHSLRFLVVALVATVAADLLIGCATQPHHESPYYDSLAVIAYRARDFSTAREQWLKALELDGNSVRALNNLAYLLYSGMGGNQDQHRAVSMWERAARMRNPESQWHLGIAYEQGTGIQQSNRKAYAWFRCAVEGAGRTPLLTEESPDRRVVRNATLWLTELRSRMSVDEISAGEQEYKGLIEYSGPRLH